MHFVLSAVTSVTSLTCTACVCRYVYLVMGVLIGSAVIPIGCCLSWKRCSASAATLGALGGLVIGVGFWLLTAYLVDGTVSISSTAKDLPMLVGNVASIGSSAFILLVVSFMHPDSYDWESMKMISMVDPDAGTNPPSQPHLSLGSILTSFSPSLFFFCFFSSLYVFILQYPSFPLSLSAPGNGWPPPPCLALVAYLTLCEFSSNKLALSNKFAHHAACLALLGFPGRSSTWAVFHGFCAYATYRPIAIYFTCTLILGRGCSGFMLRRVMWHIQSRTDARIPRGGGVGTRASGLHSECHRLEHSNIQRIAQTNISHEKKGNS